MHSQNVWLPGGSDQWNDPENWSYGEIPTPDQEVLINEGEANIPVNFVAQVGSLTVGKDGGLRFKSGIDTRLEVFGSVAIDPDADITYDAVHSKWIFKGQGEQELVTGGHNMQSIRVESDDAVLILIDALTCDAFFIISGNLDTQGNSINLDRMLINGCPGSGTNCPTKSINLSNSVITCNTEWTNQFDDGVIDIAMTPYEIRTPKFLAGLEMMYNKVVLTEYNPSSSLSDVNFLAYWSTYSTVVIDNPYTTKISGSPIIDESFKVLQEGCSIVFARYLSYIPDSITINGTVQMPEPSGECSSFVNISVSDNLVGYKLYSTADLVFNNVVVSQLMTAGTGEFTVENGVVLNSTGEWNVVNEPLGKTFYWVGSSGSYTDASNWSLSSGGTSQACIPTIVDNVVFDEKSFSSTGQRITLPVDTDAACRSLTWSENPFGATMARQYAAAGIKATLYVAGDIEISDVVDLVDQNMVWRVTPMDEIDISSVSVLPDIDVLSDAGVLLGSDISIGRLEIFNGYFSTEGYDMDGSQILLKSSSPKTIELSSSELDFDFVSFGNIYGNNNVTLLSGTSHIKAESLDCLGGNYHSIEITGPGESRLFEDVEVQNLKMTDGFVKSLEGELTIDTLEISNGAHLRLTTQYVLPLTDYYNEIGNRVHHIIVPDSDGSSIPTISGFAWFQSKARLWITNPSLCLEGEIEFQGITAVTYGSFSAFDATDLGGNDYIIFDEPAYDDTLYWVGRDGFWDDHSSWSTYSGGCSSDVHPSAAEQLIFDKASVLSGDTIRIPGNRVAKDVLFDGVDQDLVVSIGRRIRSRNLELENSTVSLVNNTNDEPWSRWWVDREVSVKNSSTLNLDSTAIVAGRIPTELDTYTISEDPSSSINATHSSELALAGTNDDNGISLYLRGSGDLSSATVSAVPPIVGEPYTNIKFSCNRPVKRLLLSPGSTERVCTLDRSLMVETLELNDQTLRLSQYITLRVTQ